MSHGTTESSNDVEISEFNQNDKHDQSKATLESWLNKRLKVEITDGRILIGTFLCTDRDLNLILASCLEYVKEDKDSTEEPRSIGLVMIPGKHIVSIDVDIPLN